jgi:hypothetical protein
MAFLKSRLFWLFILPNIVFGIIAYLTPATGFIPVLNAALVALAIGVCLAYGPPVIAVLVGKRKMDRADWLGIGIFRSWSAVVVNRMWSIVWRYMGRPDWLLESDIVSYALWLRARARPYFIWRRPARSVRWSRRGAGSTSASW